MDEIWRSIPGYEGKYEVSNLGRVKSLEHTVQQLNRWGKLQTRTYPERILDPKGNKSDYKSVSLCGKSYNVHRLVAKTFIPNPDNLPYINHKDEDIHNNCVDNLEWCTPEYNNNYGTRNARISKALKGRPMSEERKRQMSEARRGAGNPMYGKKHTEEFKQARRIQMSEARKGQHPWNYGRKMQQPPWNKGLHTRPIMCLDTNTIFECSQDAANWLSVSSAAIEYAAKHVACCKGHVFVYAESIPDNVAEYLYMCYSHSSRYKHLAVQYVKEGVGQEYVDKYVNKEA